jgi:hypothetical protein
MKIKANTLVEVELSEEEQKKIALAYLYKIYNWKEGYHISDENVYQTVTMHGHDAWNDEVFIGYATDDDYVVASLLLKIKKSKQYETIALPKTQENS